MWNKLTTITHGDNLKPTINEKGSLLMIKTIPFWPFIVSYWLTEADV